ncbi:uncharacterized protein LOC132043903 isoform X2 [Lycium ferocissimum]|uniref:uncharacterized protein LOC132043903 isoform X2 n=1 Tax=Lycium ferocissimum TaxID=112874 RepID=UPI0028157EF4|nr:uncharacterized protein LOC132043903 isoform X2 [Lycium ferocissimum]
MLIRLQVSHSSNHRQNFYRTMVNHIQDDESLTKCSVFYLMVLDACSMTTSDCWFTYLLVFLKNIGLSPRCDADVFGKDIDLLLLLLLAVGIIGPNVLIE